MGRSSRRKAGHRSGRREATRKETLRTAFKAQRRGRRYGSTLAEYETLAGLHQDRMYAALIARHNVRMENIAQPPDELLVIALDALAPVAGLDLILRKYGADTARLGCSTASQKKRVSFVAPEWSHSMQTHEPVGTRRPGCLADPCPSRPVAGARLVDAVVGADAEEVDVSAVFEAGRSSESPAATPVPVATRTSSART